MNIGRFVRREVAQGGKVPAGWRMAWYEPRRHIAVYGPIFLHWLLRLAHEFVYRVHNAIAAPAIEQVEIAEMRKSHREKERFAEEYSRGYLNGWRDCLDACVAAVEDEFSRTSQVWEAGETLREYSADQRN